MSSAEDGRVDRPRSPTQNTPTNGPALWICGPEFYCGRKAAASCSISMACRETWPYRVEWMRREPVARGASEGGGGARRLGRAEKPAIEQHMPGEGAGVEQHPSGCR